MNGCFYTNIAKICKIKVAVSGGIFEFTRAIMKYRHEKWLLTQLCAHHTL